MTLPLMPKATAVWLVENTSLTFEQIANFCGMHPLEVQGIADDEVASGIIGIDPIVTNQLTREEIKLCEQDHHRQLVLKKETADYIQAAKRKKKTKYTPVARRQDKPDAIAWFVKNAPELSDAQITKLIGTTKNTITAVRSRTHWNTSNIKPRDPVLLGLCSQTELDAAIFKAKTAAEKSTKTPTGEQDNKNSEEPGTTDAKDNNKKAAF